MQSSFNLLKRSFSSSTPIHAEIQRVGMIGLGLMGHGIAQTAANAGYEVVAYDMTQKAVDTGLQRIEKSLKKVYDKNVKTGKMDRNQANDLFHTTMGRLFPTINRSDLSDCDLVIEAIVEDLKIKKPLYKELGSIVKPSGILASNTSSLPIASMADPSGRPDRMLGLHFFNPVQMMRLVEVVRTDQTDPKVFESCKEWIKTLGKTPVSCKDTPGFIVNRLLVPYIAEALCMLERKDASQQDIDVSMQLGAGHPMGPITLADYVGLDTILFILQGWVKDYPKNSSFFVPEILKQKVAENKLGRKTGQGFYKWDGDKRL